MKMSEAVGAGDIHRGAGILMQVLVRKSEREKTTWKTLGGYY
jgi:hypothetical protein